VNIYILIITFLTISMQDNKFIQRLHFLKLRTFRTSYILPIYFPFIMILKMKAPNCKQVSSLNVVLQSIANKL